VKSVAHRALVLIGAIALQTTANAHEDPRGDVRPSVVAMDDRFEVYFTNNLQHSLGSEDPVYRMVFSAEGAKMGLEDRYIGAIPQTRDTQYQFDLESEHGRPVFRQPPRGEERPVITRPKLPPGQYHDCCILGWITKSKVVMRDSPPPPKNDESWPFSLRVVELGSGKLLGATRVGTPARIYVFACTSSVLSAGDEVILAWMETKKLPEEQVLGADGNMLMITQALYRMVLTRWQPSTGKTRHTVVASATDGNVAISIGRIGNVVLVAWHERGVIRTQAIDLNTAPFTQRLPELREQPTPHAEQPAGSR